MPMGIDEWRATRREVGDLSTVTGFDHDKGDPAYVYEGDLFIYRWHSGWVGHRAESYLFYLQIENQEWLSNELMELEAILYEYGVSAGNIA
jgi:hypothetical protein